MKKVYSFLLGITALATVSCDYNDPNDGKFHSDPEAGWVEFVNPGAVYNAPIGCSYEIPLVLDAPVNKSGVDVYYTITEVTGSTAGLSTYAVIPAGSTTGKFVVTSPAGLAGPVEFNLTLSSTNKSNIGVGSPDEVAGDETVTVRLTTGAESLLGTYDVAESSEEGDYTYESEVLQGAGPNDLIITNLYGVDANAQTKVTVNADGTLSFPNFSENFLTTYQGVGLSLEGLSGTSDPCTGVITMSFNLRYGAGGANVMGPYNVILTRQ